MKTYREWKSDVESARREKYSDVNESEDEKIRFGVTVFDLYCRVIDLKDLIEGCFDIREKMDYLSRQNALIAQMIEYSHNERDSTLRNIARSLS